MEVEPELYDRTSLEPVSDDLLRGLQPNGEGACESQPCTQCIGFQHIGDGWCQLQDCNMRLHGAFGALKVDLSVQVQVLFTVAPTQLQAEMKQRFLWGHLASLAMHPVANFVLQAALATVNKTPEVCPSCPASLHRLLEILDTVIIALKFPTAVGDWQPKLKGILLTLYGPGNDCCAWHADQGCQGAARQLPRAAPQQAWRRDRRHPGGCRSDWGRAGRPLQGTLSSSERTARQHTGVPA